MFDEYLEYLYVIGQLDDVFEKKSNEEENNDEKDNEQDIDFLIRRKKR